MGDFGVFWAYKGRLLGSIRDRPFYLGKKCFITERGIA